MLKRVKIVTDSNSGILQNEGKEMGVFVIPMPFTVGSEEYLEEITITQEEFYEKLALGLDVTTSQPSRYYLEELWAELLKDNQEVLYVPMTSGMSKTCENAIEYAKSFNDKVVVVDNKMISPTLKQSVFDAIKYKESGLSAKEIKEKLEKNRYLSSIYIMVSDIKYLKKGGRITPAAAALGSMLRVKPILYSNGDSFEKLGVALSLGQAKKKMIEQVISDLKGKFSGRERVVISVVHTKNEKEAVKFREELIKAVKDYPNAFVEILDPLSLSVSCHIGPGALAVTMCVSDFN